MLTFATATTNLKATQMKQVLLMAVLAAGMLLVGCSKDGDNGMETKDNTEQTLTKEQIVGVWRNGDYWVSFAEDGFMCGYLSDKCIVEGGYEVFQDQIIVVSDFFDNNITAFKINSVTEERIECNVKYSEMEINSIENEDEAIWKESINLKSTEATMSFIRSDVQPTTRENEIVGKRFEYYSVYPLNPKISFGDYSGDINCLSEGVFDDKGSMQRMITGLTPEGKLVYHLVFHKKGFYVYLAPHVYFAEFRDESYGVSMPWLLIPLGNIQKMEVSLDQSGKIHLLI